MENDDAESDDDNQHQKIDMLNEDPENESDNKHEIIDMLNIDADDDEDESGNLLDDFGKTEDECPMNCMCQRNFNGFLVANCDR